MKLDKALNWLSIIFWAVIFLGMVASIGTGPTTNVEIARLSLIGMIVVCVVFLKTQWLPRRVFLTVEGAFYLLLLGVGITEKEPFLLGVGICIGLLVGISFLQNRWRKRLELQTPGK